MLYEELRQRYGNHIAKRIQRDLSHDEFRRADLETLVPFIETRAEKLAQDYKTLMENPFERGNMRSEVLQGRWRQAEDLAYLLSVAEDVSLAVRAAMSESGHGQPG